MSKDHADSEIKALNHDRAMLKKKMAELETRYEAKELSQKEYTKHKEKLDVKCQKIRKKLHELEIELHR